MSITFIKLTDTQKRIIQELDNVDLGGPAFERHLDSHEKRILYQVICRIVDTEVARLEPLSDHMTEHLNQMQTKLNEIEVILHGPSQGVSDD